MAERFKLVNKSRINNNRVRLIKTGTSTSQLDPLFGAIYENASEVGLCLAPSTVISCVGAKVESNEITLDGDGWTIEVDGVSIELPSATPLTYEEMVDLLEANGIRVTELLNAVTQPIYCDGAVSQENLNMQDGGWMLEVDGIDMGGPYDLASLDEYSRRREVRITVPEPLVCDITSGNSFTFHDYNPYTLKAVINAETNQPIMTEMDALSTGFTNEYIEWMYDPNYGQGFIRNLTDKCLLIWFQSWDGDPLNANLAYEPLENATVVEREGIYYISLGPMQYSTPNLDFNVEDANGYIPNGEGGALGEVRLVLDMYASGLVNPAGVTVNYLGEEYVLMNGDRAEFLIDRIQPNNSLSENVYVLRNDLQVQPTDVNVWYSSPWDYDLWQPTTYWEELGDRDDLEITIEVEGVTTVFTGSRRQMDHADMDRPDAKVGRIMKIQAGAKWMGCAVQISDTLVDGAILDSNGYVEFIIPTITTGLWDVELINLDRIDEREFPSQFPVTRLRTVNFI